ncbi:irregular chiasm C-roughest protein-like [Branchiostoma lanceolatum]|uniref:irregular chiasm C-roughest protein-like n=1 Tax=Branchiostoma lanceolatum TaxID=7740 RepID=UPI00345472BA
MTPVTGPSMATTVLLLVLSAVLKVHSAVYRVEPEPTAVLRGQTATIRCSFNSLSPSSIVEWFGPPNLQHISQGTTVAAEYPRHRVVGDTSRGDYDLQIRRTRPEDEGMYRCRTFPLPPGPDVKLTVVEPLSGPPDIVGNERPRSAGQGLTLTCRAVGGRPPPRLTWYNGTVPFRLPESAHNTSPQNNAVSLSLAIPFVSRWDNGANLSCRADQGLPTLVEPKTAFKILSVQFPPEARILVTSMRVKAGHTVNLTCLVNSNPPAVVTWQKLGEASLVRGEVRGQNLLISSVQRSDAGVYRCKAENGVLPDGLARTTLDVLYAPDIKDTFAEKVVVLYGQDGYSLDCTAEGNPQPIVRWRRKGTSFYLNNPLVLTQVTYDVEGDYACVATGRGFPDVQRETFIDVIGRPDVLGRSGQTLFVTEGTDASLVCEVRSDPRPEVITWLWRDSNGKETIFLGAEGDSITVREVPVTRGRRSTLVIRDVGAGQAGSYVCKATNMFGSDQREFLIEIQDSQVLLITVVTAIILIIIVVTVVTVLLVRRNRCHISDQESVASSEPVSKPMPPLPPKHGPIAQAQEKPREMSLELDELDGTLKPRPPPRLDKDPYSIGLSYPRLIHALPAYSVKDQQMKASDNNSPLDDNSGNPIQTREASGIEKWKLAEANSRRPPNYHEIHVLE